MIASRSTTGDGVRATLGSGHKSGMVHNFYTIIKCKASME